ncbi:MAG: hypothetical protein NVS3B16_19800 [Vulcanimicrobiaceae bacterium]
MIVRYRNFALIALLCAGLASAMPGRAAAIIYSGDPDLALTVALVQAGGGAADFDAARAVRVLAGASFDAEYAKLKAQFGAAKVDESLAVFTYAVNDTLKVATREHIALPEPAPAASDARALRAALYRAGTTPAGKWDVGYFLEHLITHPIHHEIMDDMDIRFGHVANGTFHVVLTQLMQDLAHVE